MFATEQGEEMQEQKYTRLSKLVDEDFTVIKVNGYSWKKWDPVAKTMLTSETYAPEHSKKYDVDTDKGKMDLSPSQIGSMLEGVLKDGKADLTDRTFHVKSNGKTGMEIRYFINPVRNETRATKEVDEPDDEPINMADIPF